MKIPSSPRLSLNRTHALPAPAFLLPRPGPPHGFLPANCPRPESFPPLLGHIFTWFFCDCLLCFLFPILSLISEEASVVYILTCLFCECPSKQLCLCSEACKLTFSGASAILAGWYLGRAHKAGGPCGQTGLGHPSLWATLSLKGRLSTTQLFLSARLSSALSIPASLGWEWASCEEAEW